MSEPVTARHGMVASSQPLATDIGLDVLQQGGSAVDAAIAANAALGLMEPHMCGIGGDLFAIVWHTETGRLYGLNASGRSPRGLSLPALRAELSGLGVERIPECHPLAVSVPGAVDGWLQLHERFGVMPFSELLAPSIEYGGKGFQVTPVVARDWRLSIDEKPAPLPGDLQPVYAPGGSTPASGDVFRNGALADVYDYLAHEARRAFYEGDIAAAIDRFMREHGGYLRLPDLETHRSNWVAPVSTNYRGYDVFELPPNGQGIAALGILNLVAGYDLQQLGAGSADVVHLLIEAKKLAFEDRARHYADPEFMKIPVSSLLDTGYADRRRRLIGKTAANRIEAGDPVIANGDTVYLTTADRNGNMASLIQSIYHGFGSGLVAPGTGFALQNRGMSFSLDDAHPNVFAPGKRPFHTIIPAFLMHDGEPRMSFGVMGGDMQPQGQVQILTNIIDFGMNIQQAGDAPRWRHDGSTDPWDDAGARLEDGGTVHLEPGVADSLASALTARGHHVLMAAGGPGGFGGYQAIWRNADGSYLGASENRKDGCARGY